VETRMKEQAKGYELQAVKLTEEGSADVVVKTPYTKQQLTLSYRIADHSYTAVITSPTCTEEGYTTYTCLCGDSYVGDRVDALGHTYSSDRDGSCDRCGEKRTAYSDLRGSVKSNRDGAVVTLSGAAAYETAVAERLGLTRWSRAAMTLLSNRPGALLTR